MQRAISLPHDHTPALAKFYLEGFALLTAMFLVSLVTQPGYHTEYGIVALAVGGISCVLLRISRRVIETDVEAATTYREPAAPVMAAVPVAVAPGSPAGKLLNEVGSLLKRAAVEPNDVGVMLISVFSTMGEDPLELGTVDFVRAELYWAADFNVYELDEELLAITSSAPELEVDMERLATTLHKEVKRRRALSRSPGTEELTIGAAIAHEPGVGADDILANAQAALARAKGSGRRMLFRHL